MDEDTLIRNRLTVRTTTTRGDPPLKKLVRKFSAFIWELEKSIFVDDVAPNAGLGNFELQSSINSSSSLVASTSSADVERLCKSLLLELQNFEQPLKKTRAVIEANEKEMLEMRNLKGSLDSQIEETSKEIVQLKSDLTAAQNDKRHELNCESVRQLICAEPSRKVSEKSINSLEEEKAALEQENATLKDTVELRKKQFALLLHVIDDLQVSLNDDLLATPHSNPKLLPINPPRDSPLPSTAAKIAQELLPTAIAGTYSDKAVLQEDGMVTDEENNGSSEGTRPSRMLEKAQIETDNRSPMLIDS